MKILHWFLIAFPQKSLFSGRRKEGTQPSSAALPHVFRENVICTFDPRYVICAHGENVALWFAPLYRLPHAESQELTVWITMLDEPDTCGEFAREHEVARAENRRRSGDRISRLNPIQTLIATRLAANPFRSSWVLEGCSAIVEVLY